MEEWKSIPGFETYEASTLGNIRNSKGNILKPWIDGGGHYVLSLGRKNKQTLHRLIALTFIPPVEGKEYVDHINREKLDNRVENLFLCTHPEHSAIHREGKRPSQDHRDKLRANMKQRKQVVKNSLKPRFDARPKKSNFE